MHTHTLLETQSINTEQKRNKARKLATYHAYNKKIKKKKKYLC